MPAPVLPLLRDQRASRQSGLAIACQPGRVVGHGVEETHLLTTIYHGQDVDFFEVVRPIPRVDSSKTLHSRCPGEKKIGTCRVSRLLTMPALPSTPFC